MIYLDHSATSWPKAKGVAEAMAQAIELGNPGRSGYGMGTDASRKIFDVRSSLAELLGVTKEERVIFCSGATEALNRAIYGLMPRHGRVLSTNLEHNAVARPLHDGVQRLGWQWEKREGQHGAFAKDLSPKLASQPYDLVVINHVSNVTGDRQDLSAIHQQCREYGVPLLVDASQSIGLEPITVLEGMAIAGGGHKGLKGPMGIGFLALAENLDLEPWMRGGTGSGSEHLDMPAYWPDRMEVGTPNVPGIVGLGVALDVLLSKNLLNEKSILQSIRQSTMEACRRIKGVEVCGPNEGGTAFSLRCSADMGIVAHRLWLEHQIALRVGLHCSPLAHQALGTYPTGTLRIAPSTVFRDEDLKALTQALESILNG